MTAQKQEILIVENKRLTLACDPPLPNISSDLIDLTPDDAICSTWCWRGYIGTWEIKNNRLYLVNIRGKYKLVDEKPIFADWFSGQLLIAKCERNQPLSIYNDSICEIIEIANGQIISAKRAPTRS